MPKTAGAVRRKVKTPAEERTKLTQNFVNLSVCGQRGFSDKRKNAVTANPILNKTGGNIVEVFSSIEKTLFDKKKLNEELKNISASPNMIIKVLFIIPIVFTLIIYILNPTYFKPLLSSTLGYMIIAIIIIMFIIYILLLRRIMKIDT